GGGRAHGRRQAPHGRVRGDRRAPRRHGGRGRPAAARLVDRHPGRPARAPLRGVPAARRGGGPFPGRPASGCPGGRRRHHRPGPGVVRGHGARREPHRGAVARAPGPTLRPGGGPMTTLEARVADAAGRVGRALLEEHGGGTPTDRAGLWDPALWTVGSPRLAAGLAAHGDRAPPEAVDPADPGERDRAALAASLAGPVEVLLALGSDDRVIPTAGRNSYLMPLADRGPVLRASSCTATPPDGPALAVAGEWRDRVLGQVLGGSVPGPRSWHAEVAGPLVERLGLEPGWAGRVVLSPSGTDVESLLTAVVHGAHRRPVLV